MKKRKVIKRLLSETLALLLVLAFLPSQVYAQEGGQDDMLDSVQEDVADGALVDDRQDVDIRNVDDYLGIKVIELDTSDDLLQSNVSRYATNSTDVIDSFESNNYAADNYNWAKYSNYYYYNQLSDAKKSVWDSLDAMLNTYISTSSTAAAIEVNTGSYRTSDINCPGVFTSNTDLSDFANIYLTAHPQYYFLNNTVYALNDTQGISLGIYASFADTSARNTATVAYRNKLESLLSELGTVSNESLKLGKAKAIHDKLCNITSYNTDVINTASDGGASITEAEDEANHTQSAYSALVSGQTVCAGYSEAYEMLCTALGIDAIAVTSLGHEWNKIRVNNSWYNVDCTWDDDSTGWIYHYFMINDSELAARDEKYAHMPELFYSGLLPTCSLSTGSVNTTAGTTVPSPLGTVTAPTLTATQVTGGYTITVGGLSGGELVYYTTDGTTPTPALTKSSLYRGGTISASDYTRVRAISVRDKYLDSSVASPSLAQTPTQTPTETPTQTPTQTPVQVLNGLQYVGGQFVYYTNGSVRTDFNGVYNIGNQYYNMRSGVVTGTYNFRSMEKINTVDGSIPMYRLYNPNSGEHFYTANFGEAKYLNTIGWNYERIAWFAPSSGAAVYRMYNPNAGDHHYTLNLAEVQMLQRAGWNYEGVAWKSGGSVQMYRAYNPNAKAGSHHYTSNKLEINMIVAAGWKFEGNAWMAIK